MVLPEFIIDVIPKNLERLIVLCYLENITSVSAILLKLFSTVNHLMVHTCINCNKNI
jgi:hypothetical protein